MKSIIRSMLMGSITIDSKTELGREWHDAMEKLNVSDQTMTDRLKRHPELLKLFKEFDNAYEASLATESTYFFEIGFRRGFFLAAELYGKNYSGE